MANNILSSLTAGAAGGATVSIVINAIDNFSKTFNSFNKKMVGAGTAITAAGALAAGGITTLGLAATEGVGIMGAFNNMFGTEAPNQLKKLQEATKGTVGDIDLMKQANQALLLGIEPDALPAMFEGALAAAQATGRPVSDAIADITTGIGRQSKLILDNLGIIVNTEKAYSDYANILGKTSEELTDIEKKTAFTNATMQALQTNMENIGPIDEQILKAQQLSAQWLNAKQTLGEVFIPTVTFFIDKLKILADWFNELSPTTKKWIGILVVAGAGIALVIGPLLILIGLFPIIVAGLASVATALTFLAFNPIGIAIMAVAGLIAISILLIKKFTDVKLSVNNLGIFIENVFKGIANVVLLVWNGIIEIIESRINRIIKGFNSLIKAANKIPGVDIDKISKVNFGKFQADLFEMKDFETASKTSALKTVGEQRVTNISINNLNGFNAKDIAQELESELNKVIRI